MTHIDDLLACAEDPRRRQRLFAVVRARLDERRPAAVARAIHTARPTEPELSTRQRLVDLRSDKARAIGERWLLSSGERLGALLDALDLTPGEARNEMERPEWHPAWPEVAGTGECLVDRVPGLPDGLEGLAARVEHGRSPLRVTGVPGSGITTLAERLRARRGGDRNEIREVATEKEATDLIGSVPGLRAVFYPSPRSGSREGRADVTLEPWTHVEIATLAEALSRTLAGKLLGEVKTQSWAELIGGVRLTPLEAGYLLRAMSESVDVSETIGRRLIASVVRVRCPDFDAGVLADAFMALCAEVLRAGLDKPWPAPLSRIVAEEAVALRPALNREATDAIRTATRVLRSKVRSLGREAARALGRLEQNLTTPSPAELIAGLARAELLEDQGGLVTLSWRYAVLCTAAIARWSDVAVRAHERAFQPVAGGVAERVENRADELRRFLEHPVRATLGLRVALTLCARGGARIDETRAVIGSVVAVLRARRAPTLIEVTSDVRADLLRASEHYGAALEGPLEALPTVVRWIERAPPDPLAAPLPQGVERTWLPYQHCAWVLSPDREWHLPPEVEDRVLHGALGRGDLRGRRIAAGLDQDPVAAICGKRLPLDQRIHYLEAETAGHPARERFFLLEHLLRVHGADEHRRRCAYVEFLGPELANVGPFVPCRSVPYVQALVDVSALDALGRVWEQAKCQLEQQLEPSQLERPWAESAARAEADRVERDGKEYWPIFVAGALGQLGALDAFRWLAALGGAPRAHERFERERLRELISRRAIEALVEHRDVEGVRVLLASADPERTRDIEAAVTCDLPTALWAAEEIHIEAAMHRVLVATKDAACRAFVRRLASSDTALSSLAARRLLEDAHNDDAQLLAPWLAPDRASLVEVVLALQHPAPSLHERAFVWLDTRVPGAISEGCGFATLDSKHWWSERLAACLSTKLNTSARRTTAANVVRLCVPPDASDVCSAPAAGQLVVALHRVDRHAALATLERVGRERGAEGRAWLARAWCLIDTSPPDEVLEVVGDIGELARRFAANLPLGEVDGVLTKIPNWFWLNRDSDQRGMTLYEQAPTPVIRELSRRAPDRVVAEVSRRGRRALAENRVSDALEFGMWLIELDPAGGAELVAAALEHAGPGPVARIGRRSGR